HREALEGRNIGFSNMHQMMQDLYEGRSKALPCGAGVGMLAVDHSGELNLCHRFTGSDMETFGSVTEGIARDRLSGFIEARADRSGKGCATCRIRNLCSGGCYHESYAHFTDPMKPAYHYCDLMRDWVDFGIGVYGDLIARAPHFFQNVIAPRRANGK
ncbi:MAG: SPASM domain-containing protein, partial [Rhodobacteraceae bacterium]|nr:SPASM domain-containing protein [Paracoccaceae bacterium]MCB2152472.1 SPASM domain-containing protein [Paracoccaceae bacterium]MCB2159366.1 SPASM domain-containing protein [Paracoccaceae bacterium]